MLARRRIRGIDTLRQARGAMVFLMLASALLVHAAIPMSAEERLWIAEHPVVNYGFDANAIPYSFAKDGRHEGLDADLMALIGRKTGLRFVAQTEIGLEAAIVRMRAGALPMISLASPSPLHAAELTFTEPVLNIQFGIFTGPYSPFIESASDLDGKRVGFRRSFLIEPIASASHDILIVPYPDAVEALRAVARGDVDATVAAIVTGAYIERTFGVSRVALQAVLPQSYPLCLGVRKDDKVLLAILDKALASISPEEMRELKARWLVGEPAFTREELVATAATTAAAALFLGGLIVSWLYRRLRLQYERLAAVEERLRELATNDDMSGLGNRRAFNEALAAETRRADRQSWPISLIELDLDHFKNINDVHGHEAGDAAICEVGRAIRADLRTGENAYRVGGEEFAVILPNADADDAFLVAERIRTRIEGLAAVPTRITASFGISVRAPGSRILPEKLFSRADHALYAAKAAGRNCTRFWERNEPRNGPPASIGGTASK